MKKIFPINSLVAFARMIVCKGSDEAIPACLRNQMTGQVQGGFGIADDYFRITDSDLK